MPTGAAVDAGETADDGPRPVREILEEVTVVDDDLDDLLHVVRNVGAFGHQVVELLAPPVGVVAERARPRWLLEIVRRQERQQIVDIVETGLLIVGDERGNTRLGRMTPCATELLEAHLFAGHRLHDVGAGDEHVRRLAHHEDEVGHRRPVHRATGTRAQDDADLRDDTRRLHIAVEDAAIGSPGIQRPPGCGRRRRR